MQTLLQRRAHRSGRLAGLAPALVVLLAALALLAWTQNVSAHASLISSSPAMGAVLQRAPVEVQLSFNEPVSPLVLKLIQPDGSASVLPRHRVDGGNLQVSLPTLAQEGTYALSWRVVSSDGHPVGGTLAFSVGIPNAAPATAAVPLDPALAVWTWLTRLGSYTGLFFGIGLAICQTRAKAGPRTRLLGTAMLGLGAITTLLGAGLFGVDALALPLAGLLHAETWRIVGQTSHGLSAMFALLALACAATVWRVTALAPRRLAACAAIVLLAICFAASGHASVAPPTWLARPAIWFHTIAVTLWIGSLPALAYALGRSTDFGLLQAFSRLIPMVLVVLLATGAILVFLQFDTPSSLWQTAYGRILVLKLGLVFVLLCLGAYNRYHLTGAVLRSERAPRHTMQRLILVECALTIAILAVVALWRFTPPPRAMATIPPAATAISAHIHTTEAVAELSWTPPAAGQPSSLTLYLSQPDHSPLVVQEVAIVFSNPAAGIEPVTLPATPQNEGGWHIPDIQLPQLASWQVRIEALVSDFERIRLETTLETPH